MIVLSIFGCAIFYNHKFIYTPMINRIILSLAVLLATSMAAIGQP